MSTVSSTHPMLADLYSDLEPPSTPFSPSSPLSRSSSPTSTSLMVNYLPSKFSNTVLLSATGNSPRRRRRKTGDPAIPKMGGGVEAFKPGEARMPDKDDNDYDGLMAGIGNGKKRLRWNRFKWILFITNTMFTAYSTAALIVCLLTWFNVFTHSDIVRISNRTELIISTLAGSLGLITAMIGWAGILLNNRSFLAVYTFSLWSVFALLVLPGYLTYRRRTFNLEGKVNAQWSRALGGAGRLVIQNDLNCCGYFSPYMEATVSQTCYSRSVLPGCKKPYLDYERWVLQRWFTCAFLLVPAHIVVMVAGLLCSNHVTYRFGKGMMPKAYRLDMNAVAVIMDNYATKLAEEYGSDVADDIMKHSRSNLTLHAMPTMPYSSSTTATKRTSSGRYDSIGGRIPEVVIDP
ncbi:hypothetical protein AX17_004883 [Amanita inopinata Kibby_2008]|nr:hypothetical protein AX17_004883 [Amanita inopinata Kibby_2008]